MSSIVYIFWDVFTLTYGQAIFFGCFIGLWSIGLYEAWLGKTEKKETEVFDLSQ